MIAAVVDLRRHHARSGKTRHCSQAPSIAVRHGTIEIDFERLTLTWLADTPDEEMGIELTLSAKPMDVDLYKPETLDFGVIARAVLGAPSLASLEIALSFLRRGRRDLRERRYFESIYNNFFFLETQFAPGFSNPKQVALRFKENITIRDALAAIRRKPVDLPRGFTTAEELAIWDKRVEALNRADEKIIEELISLRGTLHHHASRGPDPRRPGVR